MREKGGFEAETDLVLLGRSPPERADRPEVVDKRFIRQ